MCRERAQSGAVLSNTARSSEMTALAGSPKSTGGAQAVDRALGLLRQVASAPADGLRLSDLAEASGLDRATAHRLLASLVANELVDQDVVTKRYTLGLDFFAMAAAASNRYDLAEVSRILLQTLSKQSGDTTMLCLRSGLNLVCVDVEMGSFPIKALPMDIGSRRPLGAGASGVAMLAALPDFEIEPTLRKLAPRLADAPGQELEHVQETVSACRALGYALVPDEPMGRIMGLAVTFANRRGRPQGTLSINGIPERFSPERLPSLLEALHSHARTVEQAMSRLPDSERHRARWAAAGGKRTERS
jgi:DNA-binding IclR family transcriptional regulator